MTSPTHYPGIFAFVAFVALCTLVISSNAFASVPSPLVVEAPDELSVVDGRMSPPRGAFDVTAHGSLSTSAPVSTEAKRHSRDPDSKDEETSELAPHLQFPRPDHFLSVTTSAIHILLMGAELMADVRLHDRVSAAGLLGGFHQDNGFLFTVGAQGNWYVVGDFDHGLQLGVHLSNFSGSDGGQFVSGAMLGAYGGYKAASDRGFTFTYQMGPGYVLPIATPEDNDAGRRGKALILNLQFGWSL